MKGFDEDRLSEVYDQARCLERAGEREAAADAYRACLAIDPQDHMGASIRIAAMGLGDIPPTVGDAYVATLFDQHADDFEDILVRQLGYGVPALMAQALSGHGRFSRGLDLGCGTGLVGDALADKIDSLIGVDLSEGMIETCFDKGVYDHLYIGEAVGFLEDFEDNAPFDIILAADVLPYIGNVEPLFEAAARRIEVGGLFVFSTEALPAPAVAGGTYIVGPHQRFHHGEPFLRDRLTAQGFECLVATPITVRIEQGEPAPGHLFVARKAAR